MAVEASAFISNPVELKYIYLHSPMMLSSCSRDVVPVDAYNSAVSSSCWGPNFGNKVPAYKVMFVI